MTKHGYKCNFCGEELKNPTIHHDIGECAEYLKALINETKESNKALLTRAENAEAIINGMFPMWIAAMSYCEHYRAADMDRMRNYYNGRDNPLTSEQLHMLFEIQERR